MMTFIDKDYTMFDDESDMDREDVLLINKAREACNFSYSPYSNFQVGAAALLEPNEIVVGSNQENSSYPSGICAERLVMYHSGANYSDRLIKKLAVTAKRKNNNTFVPVSPCGSCRQVMLEYETKQNSPIEIIMQIAENKWIRTHSCKMLLPFCFNKHSL